MKILLVDDDSAFRSRMKRSLESHALLVDEAASVAEATGMLAAGAYAACCIDLKMPEQNGLELIPEVKRQLPQAKIILLTGYGSASVVAQAFKLGAVDFLSKPAGTNDVLKALGIPVDTQQPKRRPTEKTLYPTLDQVQQEYLNKVLIECDGNVSKAASHLGLHRRSLQRKLGRDK